MIETMIQTPCANCFNCATIGLCKMRRKMRSNGNPACFEALRTWIENATVCSVCGSGVYNDRHFRDLPTSIPCTGWKPVTLKAYRAAQN